MNFNKTQNEFCILAYSFILYQKKNNDFIRRLGLTTTELVPVRSDLPSL